jgi:hypothetical protein
MAVLISRSHALRGNENERGRNKLSAPGASTVNNAITHLHSHAERGNEKYPCASRK